METMIMRHGRMVCSVAEARRWEDDGCLADFPAPGDTVIRFRDNAAPEVGRVGVRATIDYVGDGSIAETTEIMDNHDKR